MTFSPPAAAEVLAPAGARIAFPGSGLSAHLTDKMKKFGIPLMRFDRDGAVSAPSDHLDLTRFWLDQELRLMPLRGR